MCRKIKCNQLHLFDKPKINTLMKERIQKLIDYKGISPGDLAELLGVQRSNISHILNGRNKPGAVFIEKFLLAFPMVNARWLFTGEGTMIIGEADKPTKPGIEEIATVKEKGAVQIPETIKSASSERSESGKTLDRVILLYSDGTFISYDPA
jgi:transcriptional regulator with XRE-family HTH domain